MEARGQLPAMNVIQVVRAIQQVDLERWTIGGNKGIARAGGGGNGEPAWGGAVF